MRKNFIRRRDFLAAALGFAAGGICCVGTPIPRPVRGPRPTLDIHVHLFGRGDSGSGCVLSDRITGSLLFKALTALYGVGRGGETFDKGYVRLLLDHVRESGLDRIVLLAQDGVYDAAGRFDEGRTDVYTPNDHLFAVVRRAPDLLVPCVSINPERRDALDELERCAALGARVLKIHPPIQGVDVSAPKHARFFARCAELGVLVMVHTGAEHSAPVVDVLLGDPRRLRLALEQGCTVVACHSGSGWPSDELDLLPGFIAMAKTYDRLWGDTAVLGAWGRERDVRRLLDDEAIRLRLLHGSDFPFPSWPLSFISALGIQKASSLQKVKNLLHRDLELKEALGFGRASAERAWELLRRRRTWG